MTHFKNYLNQSVDWSPHVNALTGLNGMGKTNMLEAIYYLCMCKSCRGLSDQRLPYHDKSFFRLEGDFEWVDQRARVVAKVEARKSKTVEWNGIAYERLSAHIGRLPIVVILPTDVLLINNGSEERRRFFDNTLSQLDSDYLEDLMMYNRLLQRRNALLKQNTGSLKTRAGLLDTYDHQMQPYAERIHSFRSEMTNKMLPVFSKYYRQIAGRQELAQIDYKSQLLTTDWLPLQAQARDKDLALQRNTAGIHRDDWAFLIDGIDAKRYASQGQLKSFVIALKLTQYELLRSLKDEQPIILLDDLFDRLDAQRALSLMRLLHEQSFGQIFITDTDENRVKAIISPFLKNYCHYKVVDGTIKTNS